MYNVGDKIKTLAWLLCVIELVGTLVVVSQFNNNWAIFVIGAIVSLASALILYGFGELICFAQSINEKLDNLENKICYSQQFDNEDETDEN